MFTVTIANSGELSMLPDRARCIAVICAALGVMPGELTSEFKAPDTEHYQVAGKLVAVVTGTKG